MRIIIAVIASAVAIAILIDAPRRELAAQLESDWRQYRQHVGNPAFSATSENLQNSLNSRLDTTRKTSDTVTMPNARCERRNEKQGAEQWQQ